MHPAQPDNKVTNPIAVPDSAAPMVWQPVPAGKIRLEAIDGLRALAILMVYTYHVWQFGDTPALRVGIASFGAIIGQFASGVDLFMVLSGFCLFWPLASKPQNLQNWSNTDYARRRIRRIIPPYYAAITFFLLLPYVCEFLFHLFGRPLHVNSPGIWQIVTHLTFTHSLFPSTWAGIEAAFWSLGLEAQFYLVFPLVVLAVRKWGIVPVTASMIMLSVVYRFAMTAAIGDRPYPIPFLASVFFIGRWMQFAAGMIAAHIVARHSRTGRKLPPAIGLMLVSAALVLYAVAVASSGATTSFPVRDFLLAIAFAAAIVGLTASHSRVNIVFENRFVAGLGFISYSLFLIHQKTIYGFSELLKQVLHLGGNSRFALMMTLGFAIVLGISYLFFLLFERPFLNSKQTAKKSVGQSGQIISLPSPVVVSLETK